MTDREMLELAAKAAGLDLKWQDDRPHIGDWQARKWWNPLADDGDALRLAVTLHMVVRVTPWGAAAQIGERDWRLEDSANQDINAATRRAIIRAATGSGVSDDAAR